jgi:PAS domain S-box-containing protein
MASTKRQKVDSDRTVRQLVASSPDLLLVIEGDGTFVEVLTPDHPMLWMPAGQVVGTKISEIFPDSMAKQVMEQVALALDSGTPKLLEYDPPQAFGTERAELFEARFVSTAENEVVVIVRNVTERADTMEALRNAETAARDSEDRLRAVLDTAVDGIISINGSGEVLSFNHAAEKIFGYSVDEVIGRNISMLMPEPDKTKHGSYIDNFARTGDAKIIGIGREVHGLRKDGSVFPMELEVGAAATSKEQIFTGIVRDITQRVAGQQARELAERQYRDLFDSALVGIYQASPTGRYIACNPALAEILGYDSPEEVIASVGDIREQVYADPQVRDRYVQLLEQFGLIEGFEAQLRRRDGDVLWTSQNVHAVYRGDGEIVRYEGVVEDITARKAMERQVDEGRRRLEDANLELRQAGQAKDAFLSTISHELRTPLTSVKGFAEILQAYSDIDEESRTEFVGIIVNESNRLIRLINDLLDLSKIEAGKMDWEDEPTSVAGVIASSVASTRSLALEKGQRVEITPGDDIPDVVVDPDKLIQVMTNLLSNAFKFSPVGATVRINASRAGLEVVVSVEDQGIGIAPGDVPMVFERFSQAGDTLTDKPKGTGLGLSICKEIIDHYGGRIWVDSEYEAGSTFSFALPAIAG